MSTVTVERNGILLVPHSEWTSTITARATVTVEKGATCLPIPDNTSLPDLITFIKSLQEVRRTSATPGKASGGFRRWGE